MTVKPHALLIQKAQQVKDAAPKKKRNVWKAPALGDLANEMVFAFDQTFSKTGWVFLDNENDNLRLVAKGFIQEPPIPQEVPKFWDILQRTDWMGIRITEVLKEHWIYSRDIAIVHEQPILQGLRIESSLLGAVKVWEGAKAMGQTQPTIVSKTHVAGVLCPPSDRTGKAAITRGLLPFIDTTKRGTGWNEHNRDALALAITYLYDRKKQQ